MPTKKPALKKKKTAAPRPEHDEVRHVEIAKISVDDASVLSDRLVDMVEKAAPKGKALQFVLAVGHEDGAVAQIGGDLDFLIKIHRSLGDTIREKLGHPSGPVPPMSAGLSALLSGILRNAGAQPRN